MKNCLFLILLCSSFSGFGQSRNPDSLRERIFELKIKTVPDESLKLPFESIKIIDSRTDTSKLGFGVRKWGSSAESKSFYKILLKPGIEKGIENFYNNYYRKNFTDNGKTLLISIKKLWINNVPMATVKSSKQKIERSSQQDIYARFEYYSGSQNGYLPLTRVDTVFQLTPLKKVEEYFKEDEGKLPFFCFALEKMVENLNFELYTNDGIEKKKMTLADINNYNAKARNIPILTDPMIKGVFLTLDEFKNNTPSVTAFTKRKLKGTNIPQIADEKDNVILHYFAYYDGNTLGIGKPLSSFVKKHFLQKDDVLYRVGNSFQYFENHIENGSHQASVSSINENFPDIPISIPNRSIFRIPRQIDLETGEIY